VIYAGSSATNAISIDGLYQTFAGYMFAPNGRIDILGDYFTLNGAMIGSTIRLNGTNPSVVTRD
jgi:hypothetical protein